MDTFGSLPVPVHGKSSDGGMESRPSSGGFCSTTFPQREQRHLNQSDDREVDSPFVSTSQSCFTSKVKH